MGQVTTLECDGCDANFKLAVQERVYVLAGGLTLPVFAAPAWCAKCNAVVEADVLPEPEAVESLGLAGFDLARWRVWRNKRQSPPRCLECGSSKVELPANASFLKFSEDQEAMAFKHPGCRGTFRVTGVGLALGKSAPRQYDPEGARL